MCNQTLVRSRVQECFVMAEQTYNRIFTRPRVLFNKRGSTAGTANSVKNELNFNKIILDENLEHFIKQTVAHEVAHLITDAIFGKLHTRSGNRISHGKQWKSVMNVLGVPSDRCHSYDVSNAKIKRRKSTTHDYQCTRCNTILPMGTIRHNNMAKGKKPYFHKGCRGAKLKYIGITRIID